MGAYTAGMAVAVSLNEGTQAHPAKRGTFVTVDGWTAVAAVMSPGTWRWTTSADDPDAHELAEARRAKEIVVGALRFLDGQNGLPFYPTLPWLQKATAVAVTTLPLGGVLRAVFDGRQTLDVPSVCLGVPMTFGTVCNSLTVLWVRLPAHPYRYPVTRNEP
jgi:hypothetical protein